ncbi:MAG: DUF4339 domain-containing protein [Muribaculaceae bacterium]|nr:DUF4339 domain-containing protein [Muribaculaceae bacterium]
MKFFARIEDKQVGPLTLTELVKAGVRPSDYIWHKGMPDWERADEVPEVCRGMRRYLAGYDPETGELMRTRSVTEVSENPVAEYGTSIKDNPGEESGERSPRQWIRNLPEGPDLTDYNQKPRGVSIVGASVVTLLCFPLTGLLAVWYGMKCNAHWKLSCQPGLAAPEVEKLRRRAHNDARLYKMMTGITICIGVMMIGFALFR